MPRVGMAPAFIIPTNAECVSSDTGTGDNTATGRPRFVTVTASPSRFISLMTSTINRRRTDSSPTPDIVLRGDRGNSDETLVPASQPIVGCRDLCPAQPARLAFREIKQFGRGPAVK